MWATTYESASAAYLRKRPYFPLLPQLFLFGVNQVNEVHSHEDGFSD